MEQTSTYPFEQLHSARIMLSKVSEISDNLIITKAV